MTGPSVRGALNVAIAALREAGFQDPSREAKLLLANALGVETGRITLLEDEALEDDAHQRYKAALSRRLNHEPMSHILGRRAFFKHEFFVNSDVLDPRPETEVLVMAALNVPFQTVLDLGTGSGAILLSLLAERGQARGVGTDISNAALHVAAINANAQALGVSNRVVLCQSDWFAAIETRFDLIVSNPPYISSKEMGELAPELGFEPRIALTDEGDGLTAYRVIAAEAGSYLNDGGHLMVEVGWQQGPVVAELFRDAGFAAVTILPDLDGRDRVVSGIWPG